MFRCKPSLTRACTLYHCACAAQVRLHLSFFKLTDTWSKAGHETYSSSWSCDSIFFLNFELKHFLKFTIKFYPRFLKFSYDFLKFFQIFLKFFLRPFFKFFPKYFWNLIYNFWEFHIKFQIQAFTFTDSVSYIFDHLGKYGCNRTFFCLSHFSDAIILISILSTP